MNPPKSRPRHWYNGNQLGAARQRNEENMSSKLNENGDSDSNHRTDHPLNNLSPNEPDENGNDSDDDNTRRTEAGRNKSTRPQFDPHMQKTFEMFHQIINVKCEDQDRDAKDKSKEQATPPPHERGGTGESTLYAENVQMGDKNVMLVCHPKESKSQLRNQQVGDRNIMINVNIMMNGCQMVNEDNTIVQVDSEGEVWLEIRRKPKRNNGTKGDTTPSQPTEDKEQATPSASSMTGQTRPRSPVENNWDSTEVTNHGQVLIMETGDRLSMRLPSRRHSHREPVENSDSTLMDDDLSNKRLIEDVLCNERVKQFFTDDRNSYDITCYELEYENEQLYVNTQETPDESEDHSSWYSVVSDQPTLRVPSPPSYQAPPIPERVPVHDRRDRSPGYCRSKSDNSPQRDLHARPQLPTPRKYSDSSHVKKSTVPVPDKPKQFNDSGHLSPLPKAHNTQPAAPSVGVPSVPPRSPTIAVPTSSPGLQNQRPLPPTVITPPVLPERPIVQLERPPGYTLGRLGTENNAAKIEEQPWYHDHIDRSTSSVRLERNKQEMSFLVRPSSNDARHAYSLDVFFQGRVDRLKIWKTDDDTRYYLEGSDDKKFSNVCHLIDKLMEKGLEIKDVQGIWTNIHITPLDSSRFRGNQ